MESIYTNLKIYILLQLPPNQRDNVFALKRYSLWGKKTPLSKPMIIAFVDGKSFHGGLCDRFKGMVSLFHFSLIKGYDFRISHTFPFDLEEYLLPNQCEWRVAKAEICTCYRGAKYMNLIKDGSIARLKDLRTTKQVHCYANRDITDALNRFYGTSHTWGELFRQLFQPSDELATLISYHKTQLGAGYVSVVFRFQNLLGDFFEYDSMELDTVQKERLIRQNLEGLDKLVLAHPGVRILVTSDSTLFLERAATMSQVYTLPGKVVHIDNKLHEPHDVYQKSFLDFYMLAEGDKIYSAGTEAMYKSDFPFYAAKVHDIPFERILIGSDCLNLQSV